MRKVAAAAMAVGCLAVLGLSGGTVVRAQGGDANKLMADVREALGGGRLDLLRSLTVEGRALRTNAAGATTEHGFEMAMELPDKFWKREVVAAMGNMSVYRMSGFNGDGLINEIDTPPQLSGGGHVMIRTRVAGGPEGDQTPEQREAARKTMLANTKRDYARMMLGLLGAAPAAYPLTFAYAGVAESPDGKAEVIDVKGEDGFAARLFVDSQTHLPLMLSWMDKEPMIIQRMVGAGGGAPPPPPAGGHVSAGGGGATWVVSGGARPGGAAMTPEERAKFDEEMKAADAKRKTVEFRIFYSDYQQVDGLTLPHRFQRSVDGKPAEEVIFERVKVNAKIDAKKFTVSKQ